MCQFKMKSYTFCRILARGLVTCACSHRFAMLSRQWSSNTLKYGIDLLESQCTEPPTRITDLEEMIRAIWINIRNQIAMFFFLKMGLWELCCQLRFKKNAFDECRPRWRTSTGHQRNWRVTVVETQAQHIPHSTHYSLYT